MSSENDGDIDVTDIKIELDGDDSSSTEVKSKKTAPENENVTPLEDRFGHSLWVQTRMCYCPDNAETDCRFHSQKEAGWEVCPHTDLSKKNRHVKGRWLWARNPNYGKVESTEQAKEEVSATLMRADLPPTLTT